MELSEGIRGMSYRRTGPEDEGRDEKGGGRAREDGDEFNSEIAGREYDGDGVTAGSAAINGSEERGTDIFRSAFADETTSSGDVVGGLLENRGSLSDTEDDRQEALNFAAERFRLDCDEAENVTKSTAQVLVGLLQTRASLSEAEDNSRELSE